MEGNETGSQPALHDTVCITLAGLMAYVHAGSAAHVWCRCSLGDHSGGPGREVWTAGTQCLHWTYPAQRCICPVACGPGEGPLQLQGACAQPYGRPAVAKRKRWGIGNREQSRMVTCGCEGVRNGSHAECKGEACAQLLRQGAKKRLWLGQRLLGACAPAVDQSTKEGTYI